MVYGELLQGKERPQDDGAGSFGCALK